MPIQRITKAAVDQFTCAEGKDRDFMWDSGLEGFGLCVYPSGKKVYVIQYRHSGRSRRVAIGDHGKLTPDQARSEAKKMLGAAERGIDHVEQRRAARAVPTFGETANRFQKLHTEKKRKHRTADGYQSLLDRHILPAIGSKRLLDVRRSDVIRMHQAVSASTPGAANRAVALVSAIWRWAAKQEEVSYEANPARGVEKNPEHRKEHFLTTEQLRRLGDALVKAETVGLPWDVDPDKPNSKHAPAPENRMRRLDPYAIASIRMLIFTGARLREMLHLRWDAVDRERGIILLEQSKTGRKTIYLSAAAMALLTALPRVSGNPHVFPGAKAGSARSDLKKPWAAIQKAAGLDGVRLHDLRHTFASYGASANLGLPIIGKLLGHTQATTTERYAHLMTDPLRQAAEKIGATLEIALKGESVGRTRHPE